MFTDKDYSQMAEMGINPADVIGQLDSFKNGFPFLNIVSPATKQRGIKILSESDKLAAVRRYNSFTGSLCKFVPASGAATRMFKDIYDLFGSENIEDFESKPAAVNFFNNIEKFPFYRDLERIGAFNSEDKRECLKLLLEPQGLNYGQLPKGLLMFHRYNDEVRTAFEEHLHEAAIYSLSSDGIARAVFTVSPEHETLFKELSDSLIPVLEAKYGCKFEVTFTNQKKSTDTIAVDPDNKPFRLNDTSLLFRPAGHGALIENLNEISCDVVIIKNIDNIPMDRSLNENSMWKKVLTGTLLEVKDKIFSLIKSIEYEYNDQLAREIYSFYRDELSTDLPEVPDNLRRAFLMAKLDRPIRVCGMVKNQGEPGGGPYLVMDADGSVSPQILESAQLNFNDQDVVRKVKESTHFNPVDLVCYIKDHEGEKFNLKKFTDSETGFISEKSLEGRPLKALELPGLWNGAMSNWNTLFVEVPVSTFSPVKTVFDLLRQEHQ